MMGSAEVACLARMAGARIHDRPVFTRPLTRILRLLVCHTHAGDGRDRSGRRPHIGQRRRARDHRLAPLLVRLGLPRLLAALSEWPRGGPVGPGRRHDEQQRQRYAQHLEPDQRPVDGGVRDGECQPAQLLRGGYEANAFVAVVAAWRVHHDNGTGE